MPTKARIIKEHARVKPLRKHGYIKCPACGVKLVWPYDERCPECDLAFWPGTCNRRRKGLG